MLIRTQPIPKHFYDLQSPERWRDRFATQDGTERLILSPREIILKGRRRTSYLKWLHAHNLPGLNPTFQAIRLHNPESVEQNRRAWWPKYTECFFWVFVNPHTEYSGLVHRQWYVLAPEESEMVIRYELEAQGVWLPKRSLAEPWISNDKRLRKVRLVPVECCRHCRHEGKEVDGLI
jgi:hypothetical protein